MAIGTPVVGAVTTVFAQTVEIALPATVNDGDLLTIHAYFGDNQAAAMGEAGWTEQQEVLTHILSDSSTYLYTKIAASESGTYTLDFGGGVNNGIMAFMVAWPGADQTTPMDVTSVGTADIGNNSDTAATPAITTVTNNAVVVSQIAANQTTASPGTVPSGYTALAQSGTTEYIGTAYKLVASFGTETPGTWSGLGTGADSGGITFAIRSAATTSSGLFNGTNRGVARGVMRGVG